MATSNIDGGGFTSGLVKSDIGVAPDYAFLASEKYIAKRAGATFASSAVTADADGNKIVKAGTFVTPITSGAEAGKYGPYDGGATDGREAPDPNTSGYTFESINLVHGDVTAGLLIEGSVLDARVTPGSASGAVSDAVAGRIIFQ